MLSTSTALMTAVFSTLQNRAIFSLRSVVSLFSDLHRRIRGWIPISLSFWTECCVGFDLSSPAAAM